MKILHEYLVGSLASFSAAGRRAWLPAALVILASTTLEVVAATPTPLSPEISLSLRGAGDAIVEQGEPLRIAVRIRAPRGSKEKIILAPANGTWADAVRVEIIPASEKIVAASAEVVGKPDSPQAILDGRQIAGGLWRVSSEAVQRLAPGSYVVRARLSISAGSGWTGDVASVATRFEVVTPSGSPDRVAQRAVNRAHDFLLSGDVEGAASILDAVLLNSPDDVRLLTARAVVAESAGNIFAAMICVNRADRARPLTSKGPPPIELQELQARLRLAIGDASQQTEPPADWTWPPANVMLLPATMLPALSAGKTTSLPVAASVQPTASTTRAPSADSRPTPVLPINAALVKPPEGKLGSQSPGAIIPSSELTDAKIVADDLGQWAASAIAGSQYGKTQYSAAQATAAPNISVAGNSPDAWCPAVRDRGTDWIELTFASPIQATEVRVRQNDAPGAITKIEAIEPDGTVHVWWEGVDPHQRTEVRQIVWFAIRVPKTDYAVARMKLTLNLASGPGYKEIDAVQLVSSRP
jgi:hypothetical protein